MMKWIKNNAIIFTVICFIAGIICAYLSNDYSISAKTISTTENGIISNNIIYMLESRKVLFNIFSNIFSSLGIALFISSFFIRYIENEEREEFKKELLSFQENTSKDAIHSIFKRMIDKDFFNLIKKELFNASSIRKNANWQYDITEKENGHLELTRTVSYEFHNISDSVTQEHLKLISNFNQHSQTEVVSAKVRYTDGKEIEIDSTTNKQDGFTKLEQEFTINPQENVEVILVFKELFKNGYIFQTHSSRHPIINLEIIVNFPSNYNFNLFSTFSIDERLKINEPTKKVWIAKGAIFRGQGIEFICEKRKS